MTMYDTNFQRFVMTSCMRWLGVLDPERAHALVVWALEHIPTRFMLHSSDDPILSTELWGESLPNPIGLAAGFDKDARVFEPSLRLGFGFVETGTVTPQPQRGNTKPRVFRLSKDAAVINRLGFNNCGMEEVAGRLAGGRQGMVGANIGMNRDSSDPLNDYASATRVLAPLVDYIAVNVSSPNTPGLRLLQERKTLEEIIEAVKKVCKDVLPNRVVPIVIKISPDLDSNELSDVIEVALSRGVDGLIIGNTTTSRPSSLKDEKKVEDGGLSGRPLFTPSTEMLGKAYRMSSGRLLLIGTGGIENGMDAYSKIRAGATVVQLYTGLIYGGPLLISKIKRELAACLRADGCRTVADAVGADHR